MVLIKANQVSAQIHFLQSKMHGTVNIPEEKLIRTLLLCSHIATATICMGKEEFL